MISLTQLSDRGEEQTFTFFVDPPKLRTPSQMISVYLFLNWTLTAHAQAIAGLKSRAPFARDF
jgi:hypothetical protein